MADSSTNHNKNSGNINSNLIKSMVNYYESMDCKNRLTTITVTKQSYQNVKFLDSSRSWKNITISSSVSGESNSSLLSRSALETFNVTNLKRSPAFHHRKKHQVQNKVASMQKVAKTRVR